jgi:hypothetical protein
MLSKQFDVIFNIRSSAVTDEESFFKFLPTSSRGKLAHHKRQRYLDVSFTL